MERWELQKQSVNILNKVTIQIVTVDERSYFNGSETITSSQNMIFIKYPMTYALLNTMYLNQKYKRSRSSTEMKYQ